MMNVKYKPPSRHVRISKELYQIYSYVTKKNKIPLSKFLNNLLQSIYENPTILLLILHNKVKTRKILNIIDDLKRCKHESRL